MSEEIMDTTGITGTGRAAETARLVQQFGMPTVILSAFLAIFIGTLSVVRYDFLRQDEERTQSHERIVTKLAESFTKHFEDARSDTKDERAAYRENQEKMRLEIRDLVNATKDGNDLTRKTIDELRKKQ